MKYVAMLCLLVCDQPLTVLATRRVVCPGDKSCSTYLICYLLLVILVFGFGTPFRLFSSVVYFDFRFRCSFSFSFWLFNLIVLDVHFICSFLVVQFGRALRLILSVVHASCSYRLLIIFFSRWLIMYFRCLFYAVSTVLNPFC